MSNPLVADAVDTATPFSGAGILDSGTQLAAAIESGNWVEGGLAAFSTAADAVATVSDPLGSLIGAGLGWLMDHMEPLKGWMNDLTGDAGQVAGFAQTWENMQTQLEGAAQTLDHVVTDLDEMSGQAIEAYRRFQADAAAHIRTAGRLAGAMGAGLEIASTIVQVVHDVVRDVLSQLVGSAISWAAEAVFTLGLATPLIIEQVSTRVASLAAKVGSKVTAVLASCKNLMKLLDELKALFRNAGDLFDTVLRGGGGPRPRRGDSTPGRHLPDDVPTKPYPDPADWPPVPIDESLVDHTLVDAFPPKTGPDDPTFWSGRVLGPDGEPVPDAAMRSAADLAGSTHGSTLEQMLQRQGLYEQMPDDWLDPSTPATWRSISKALAENASGDVRAVLGDVRTNSVWNEVELPALSRNPNVTSITVVDAATGKVLHVYQR